ncbi:MAG: GDSL-type esterase/lipase family protein [Candidatus Pacearchaeota archaeon]|nr:GDSL-type esterase/lipase family protein [Candidatus Pacearchaeota archaeon]
MEILVFGDSLTYGAWDKEGGWVARLRRFIDEKYPEQHFVYNLGVPGDTSKHLIERFEPEAKIRIFDKDPMVIFQVGANDSAILSSKRNAEWISPKDFERNIRRLIFEARKITNKIFFVGHVFVDEKKTRPVSWDKDVSYTNENIKKYGDITKEICSKENISFIDIFPDFKKQDFGHLLQDGVHPTSAGHEAIFRTVRDFLVKNKVI